MNRAPHGAGPALGRGRGPLFNRRGPLFSPREEPPISPVDSQVHDALTDGYAHLLTLDADCKRLRERLNQLILTRDAGPRSELRAVARWLREAEDQLVALRHTLEGLRAELDPAGKLL
jgi:hypothetical protein